MNRKFDDDDDDLTPIDLPPTYAEATSTGGSYAPTPQPIPPPPRRNPAPPPRTNHPPPPPHAHHSQRPPQPPPPQRPSPVTNNKPSTESLYTGNSNLPFGFPKGYLCQKCKNTGYKIKNGEVCRNCWDKFYLKTHAYNPNPSLPFKFPRNYYCKKCNNTGYKKKNGATCKECWALYSPRNNYSSVRTTYQPSYFGSTTFIPAGNGFMNTSVMSTTTTTMAPPMRVPPGDPRLGGVVCGNCRGSGMVRFLLDMELCPVCAGLGRLVNVPNRVPVPPPPPPAPATPYYYYGKR
ncbi:uncharacterized protein J8A68_005575 [[Candida] subhashii]|uniref:Proline-rich protein HUA1 n=1 Tax=[Candida] subhashii TaxID=561895 RepID=A0A8J5QG10_9ASCO|nr:uncharacterized protein J8A68_005575 [[Candida] subhashii]KAG7660900.1 hypothetical protein J8A68_005575 [[Candida] subhashii]